MEILLEIFGELFISIVAASSSEKMKRKLFRKLALHRRLKNLKRSCMKSTDLSPYIGSNVEIYDALGNCFKGSLKDVTDTTAVVLDKKYAKSIISLDYIVRAVVSEGVY